MTCLQLHTFRRAKLEGFAVNIKVTGLWKEVPVVCFKELTYYFLENIQVNREKFQAD
jgi:hypothetical protein